jgi:4-hydroxy-3-methylbut-2-en-1-yl diphosphate reductase
MKKTVIIANPHGFCSGVRAAIETIEKELLRHKAPLYCLHQIVHNSQVVADLSARGVLFVDTLNDIPEKGPVVFSAHGVSPAVRAMAIEKKLQIIDATCPFVSKVHSEVRRFASAGCSVLIVGQADHDEVVGVAGEAPEHVMVVENEEDARRVSVPNPELAGVVCQTTLSASFAESIVAILKSRFPKIRSPSKSDVCYATQDRQRAVQKLAAVAEMMLVVGSKNSANTRRLVEVSASAGCRSIQISDLDDMKNLSLDRISALGITSGASTPESFLNAVLKELAARGFKKLEHMKKEDL